MVHSRKGSNSTFTSLSFEIKLFSFSLEKILLNSTLKMTSFSPFQSGTLTSCFGCYMRLPEHAVEEPLGVLALKRCAYWRQLALQTFFLLQKWLERMAWKVDLWLESNLIPLLITQSESWPWRGATPCTIRLVDNPRPKYAELWVRSVVSNIPERWETNLVRAMGVMNDLVELDGPTLQPKTRIGELRNLDHRCRCQKEVPQSVFREGNRKGTCREHRHF